MEGSIFIVIYKRRGDLTWLSEAGDSDRFTSRSIRAVSILQVIFGMEMKLDAVRCILNVHLVKPEEAT